MLLTAPDARAGSYTGPVYTGSGTSTRPAGQTAASYATGTTILDSVSYTGYGGDASGTQSSGAGTASCTGSITATFTWQPDPGQSQTTDPPGSVIVTETCLATAAGTSIPAAVVSGSCDNKIGVSQPSLPQTPLTSGSPPQVYGTSGKGVCYSTRYGVQSGGATVTLTLSPGATASSTQGSSASVRYTATVSPVFVIPGGAIKDSSGTYNILVGQGCTASLSGIPTSTGFTTTYNWSVSGNTLQSWIISDDETNAKLTGGFGIATNPTAHWYWSDVNGPETVTCTANVTPPAGQGSPFPVSAAQSVTLVRPSVSLAVPTGRVQINNLDTTDHGTGYTLYAGGKGSFTHGITFKITVTTPAPFKNSSSGLWNLVQTVTPGAWYTLPGKPEQGNPSNGKLGLDTYYPLYPGPHSAQFPGGVPANGLTLPTEAFDSPAVGNLTSTYPPNIHYRVYETFTTYLMYLLPGLTTDEDTCWVPLKFINWYWRADDSIPGLTWANWDNSVDAGTIAVTNINNRITNPEWNLLVHG